MHRTTTLETTVPAPVAETADERADGTTAASAPPAATVPPQDGDRRSPFVAAVLAADGVLFSAVAADRGAAMRGVAEYVRGRLDTRLWPAHAAQVRALLDRGEHEAAVSRYVACVGQRWDEEWLVVAAVDARGGGPVDDATDGPADGCDPGRARAS